eukprot:CAMPEP_0202872666 /NCGR_PEP_ID=MMETSP1391-20130828/21738_1 /ASSEMBLY_ACC=CAM_ASM_000867 /TAXON_ID=1034604 /ORGANISM="Chlamydomonas leiostraca, Strain SAG 11-49" /LENGTH=56 /DNA_ID=CAMNT_0049553765 /DNA_START=74 /DNA_END=240 /DNA_ORIENTATION=-
MTTGISPRVNTCVTVTVSMSCPVIGVKRVMVGCSAAVHVVGVAARAGGAQQRPCPR